MDGQELVEELDRGEALLAEINRSCGRLAPSLQWRQVENMPNLDSDRVLAGVVDAFSQTSNDQWRRAMDL